MINSLRIAFILSLCLVFNLSPAQRRYCSLAAYTFPRTDISSPSFKSVNVEYDTRTGHPTKKIVLIPDNFSGDIVISGSWPTVDPSISHLSNGTFLAYEYYDYIRDKDGKIVYTTFKPAVWTGPDIVEQGYFRFCQKNGDATCFKQVATVPNPSTEEGKDYYSPYIRVTVPKDTATYYFASTSLGAINYEPFITTVVLLRGQAFPSTISHYHRIADNLALGTSTLLSTNYFSVCADGSEVSKFVINADGSDSSVEKLRIKIREDKTGDELYYGKFGDLSYPKKGIIEVSYKHPSQFEGSGKSKTVTVELYSVDFPQFTLSSYPLTIYRPPVVMVHGLWSSASAFAVMEKSLSDTYNKEWLIRADYSKTNAAFFATNKSVVPDNITSVLVNLREKQIAAGKVDLVGHSMGGLLSRQYLQSLTYRNDIHKLITINSPHSGSQQADMLLWASGKSSKICNTIIPNLAKLSNASCDDGAIWDLSVNSGSIDNILNKRELNRNIVPSHTITTTTKFYSNTLVSYLEMTRVAASAIFRKEQQNDLFTMLAFVVDINDVSKIFNEANDQIVALSSQRGGVSENCQTPIQNQTHTGSPENPNVINRVKELLTANSMGPLFCSDGFHPVDLQFNLDKNPAEQPRAGGRLAQQPSLKIRQPLVGSSITPGGSLSLIISGQGIKLIKAIVTYNADSVYLAQTPTDSVWYTVPVGNTPGKRSIVAIGQTATGDWVTDTTYFYVCQPISVTLPGSATLNCAKPTLSLSSISSTTGVSYHWNTESNSAAITVTSPGLYSVTATSVYGCVASATTSVGRDPKLPPLQITGDKTLSCAKTSVLLTATSDTTRLNYKWSTKAVSSTIAVSTSGIYSVTGTTTNGCSAVATFAVDGSTAQPLISILGNSILTCNQPSIVLSTTSTTNNLSYRWNTGELTPTKSVTTAGVYSVTATTPENCTATNSVYVSNNFNSPVIAVKTSGALSQTVISVTLTVSSSVSSLTYVWSTGQLTSSIEVKKAGVYSVTALATTGCTAVASITVNSSGGRMAAEVDLSQILDDQLQVKAYPIPAKNRINVTVRKQSSGPVFFRLISTNGTSVLQNYSPAFKGYSLFDITLPTGLRGVYFLLVKDDQYSQTIRILVE